MSFISFLGFEPEFERQIVLFVDLQRDVKRAANEFGFDGDMFSNALRHDKSQDEQIAFFNVWREIDQPMREACKSLAKKMVWNAILNTPKK